MYGKFELFNFYEMFHFLGLKLPGEDICKKFPGLYSFTSFLLFCFFWSFQSISSPSPPFSQHFCITFGFPTAGEQEKKNKNNLVPAKNKTKKKINWVTRLRKY